MPDRYLIIRGGLTSDYVTAQRAREFYAEAASNPQSRLAGDLDTGFSFWIVHADSDLLLVHCRLLPVPYAPAPAPASIPAPDAPAAPTPAPDASAPVPASAPDGSAPDAPAASTPAPVPTPTTNPR